MMRVISIKELENINTKTKFLLEKTNIKELPSIFEKQNEILAEVLNSAKHQNCKESTMLSDDEWYYFNIKFENL